MLTLLRTLQYKNGLQYEKNGDRANEDHTLFGRELGVHMSVISCKYQGSYFCVRINLPKREPSTPDLTLPRR